MQLPFLQRLIHQSPPESLTDRLTYTAYDELLIIDLRSRTFTSRFHTDGKFFSPVLGNSYIMLLNYIRHHMVHPEDQAAYLALNDPETMPERFAAADPPDLLSGVIRYLALDGNWHRMEHLLLHGPRYGLPEGTVYLYLYDVQTVLDRETGQHQSFFSADRLMDQMPGMLTENAFFSMAQERLSVQGSRWCMVAVDIKHFKLFKDMNGQEKGDTLLIRFADILNRLSQSVDGLAGYRGQDDFCLFVPFDNSLIEHLFNELKGAINDLSSTSGFFPILGISMVEDSNETALDLFNRAALTAEEIKDDLQFHIRVYDPQVHERHVEEFKLLTDFQNAIRDGEISFYLQPQCHVQTGRIVGAESLSRWIRPDGTFISPAVFVPVLEKYDIVTHLDTYIWESVCSWLRRIMDRGLTPVPVSVNVSRIDIFSLDVPGFLLSLTQKYNLPVRLLKVEITESAYVNDADRVLHAIAELRANGFQVLMDDFGSGYSSLNMLGTVNMDVIKLDAQFLHFNVGTEQKSINILESIINMTTTLTTPIIVEGVDTQEMVQYLTDMGCRYMQGFYFYRPMPVDCFESLLSHPEKLDLRGFQRPTHDQMHTREFLDSNIYSDAMLNNILGPVCFYAVKDENIDIIRFNQQFLNLITLDADMMEERRNHIQNFFYAEDMPKFFAMLKQAAEDRINGANGLFRIYKPNGTLFWMQLHVYYLRQDEQDRSIFYGSARDMTELQYINADLPGGYFRCALDQAFTLRYTSKTFLEMLGCTQEDIHALYADSLAAIIHPDDLPGIREQSKKIRQGKASSLPPYRVRHKDGHYLYVIEQSRLTDIYGEICWQSVMIDITEVMTLRNRMHLLEQYSSECIVFIRCDHDDRLAEAVVYGLEAAFGMNQDDFIRALNHGEIRMVSESGRQISLQSLSEEEDPAPLNGLYILSLPNGKHVRTHLRFSRILSAHSDVDFILSFSPASLASETKEDAHG